VNDDVGAGRSIRGRRRIGHDTGAGGRRVYRYNIDVCVESVVTSAGLRDSAFG
jgi:hypothetical protein